MIDDVVVGGGFAGLSAAVELAARGRKVLVLERRVFLGGRAFSFDDRITGTTVDNGQHLMMGCYRSTLAFLDRIGSLDKLRHIPDGQVTFVEPGGRQSVFQYANLPAPLHLLGGLARLGTLGWSDRISGLKLGLALRRLNGQAEDLVDTTVRDWLIENEQTEKIQQRFWDPLAHATLNESPERAAADMFAVVLKLGFMGTREDSSLILSRVGLSDLYVSGAKEFIESRDGRIRLNAPVHCIEHENGRVTALVLRNGERIKASTFTFAVPPASLLFILGSEAEKFNPVLGHLEEFKTSPIVSINLWFDRPVTNAAMAGLLDSPIEWIFNKNLISGTEGTLQQLALVASGAHKLALLPKEDIVETAITETEKYFPEARRDRLVHTHVVREREATMSHLTGMSRLRPQTKTLADNLFLAGDWTATGLPATIESAVRSGQAAAQAILER